MPTSLIAHSQTFSVQSYLHRYLWNTWRFRLDAYVATRWAFSTHKCYSLPHLKSYVCIILSWHLDFLIQVRYEQYCLLLTHYALPRAFRLQPNFIGYISAFADSQACDPVWIDEQDGLVLFDFNSVARS